MPDRIWSVAEGADGELYLLAGPSRGDLFTVSAGETDGSIYKLVPPSGPPNGIAGDINQYGDVDDLDITAMIAGWYTTGHATNYIKYTHGDLNLDGITNIYDMYLLHEALLASGAGSGADLLENIPEPNSVFLLSIGFILAARRQGVRLGGAKGSKHR